MDRLSVLAMAAEAVQKSEARPSRSTLGIRKARLEDIPYLGLVERSAAEIFRTVNMSHLADGPTLDPSLLATMTHAGHLWVALDSLNQPIGFACGENIENNFHIVEISVALEVQGRGIGRMLMQRMDEDVRLEGYRVMTLTTNRYLSWNGPWYRKLGFEEVRAELMGPSYGAILEMERQDGHNMAQRCVMRKVL